MLLLKRRQNNFIKDGTAAESSVWKMLLPSFLGIIVCTICLAGMTWAWFTSGVQSQSTITADEYSLNETITPKAGGQALEKSSEGTYALAANTTYVVKVTPTVTPQSGGYCIVKIISDGGEAKYYTQSLNASQEFNFLISNGSKAVSCQVIAAWGTPDASKTANNTLLGSGSTITVNGGAPADVTQPAQDSVKSDSNKTNSDSDASNAAKDSNASSGSDQKDDGAANTNQKSDQETTGE